MGCCTSCLGDPQNIYEDNQTNDKSNLLGSPVGESSRNSNYFSTAQRNNSQTEKIDDQAKLNRILQDTAKNYIDVPALNSPVEQPNYNAWEKHYDTKFKDSLQKYAYQKPPVPLLMEVLQLEQMLSTEPLSIADRNMVDEMCHNLAAAMDSFEVRYNESIIIPFTGLPKIS